MLSQTGDGQGENTGPEGGAEQSYTGEGIDADHAVRRENADEQGHDRHAGEDQQLPGRISFAEDITDDHSDNDDGIDIKRMNIVSRNEVYEQENGDCQVW